MSDSENSKWKQFFVDMTILEQIDKDVRRTLPDFAFFQQPIQHSALYDDHLMGGQGCTAQGRRALFKRLAKMAKNDDFELVESESFEFLSRSELDDNRDMHWEAIERILFIYAKLNPGLGYVQGMNEILGPLYYVVATQGDPKDFIHAEADSFFIFTALIGEFRDHFIKSMDNIKPVSLKRNMSSLSDLEESIKPLEAGSEIGIGSTMNRLMARLRILDPSLSELLVI